MLFPSFTRPLRYFFTLGASLRLKLIALGFCVWLFTVANFELLGSLSLAQLIAIKDDKRQAFEITSFLAIVFENTAMLIYLPTTMVQKVRLLCKIQKFPVSNAAFKELKRSVWQRVEKRNHKMAYSFAIFIFVSLSFYLLARPFITKESLLVSNNATEQPLYLKIWLPKSLQTAEWLKMVSVWQALVLITMGAVFTLTTYILYFFMICIEEVMIHIRTSDDDVGRFSYFDPKGLLAKKTSANQGEKHMRAKQYCYILDLVTDTEKLLGPIILVAFVASISNLFTLIGYRLKLRGDSGEYYLYSLAMFLICILIKLATMVTRGQALIKENKSLRIFLEFDPTLVGGEEKRRNARNACCSPQIPLIYTGLRYFKLSLQHCGTALGLGITGFIFMRNMERFSIN